MLRLVYYLQDNRNESEDFSLKLGLFSTLVCKVCMFMWTCICCRLLLASDALAIHEKENNVQKRLFMWLTMLSCKAHLHHEELMSSLICLQKDNFQVLDLKILMSCHVFSKTDQWVLISATVEAGKESSTSCNYKDKFNCSYKVTVFLLC